MLLACNLSANIADDTWICLPISNGPVQLALDQWAHAQHAEGIVHAPRALHALQAVLDGNPGSHQGCLQKRVVWVGALQSAPKVLSTWSILQDLCLAYLEPARGRALALKGVVRPHQSCLVEKLGLECMRCSQGHGRWVMTMLTSCRWFQKPLDSAQLQSSPGSVSQMMACQQLLIPR